MKQITQKIFLSIFSLLLFTMSALAQYVTPVQMRDANLTTTNVQNYITTLQSFSTPRTLTIPDRSSLNAYFIQFIDTAGAVNGSNTLTIQVADGSLINGSSTLVISAANEYVFLAPNSSGYSATVIPQFPFSIPGGSPGQVEYNNSGVFGGFTLGGDATLNTSSGVMTLATVNANVGSFGNATNCANFTVNAKGLLTAAGAVTCTPALGSITGFGTGVATALGVNVGSAGAPVLFNGAGGTPSSLTLTNATGLPRTSITGLGTNVSTALGNTLNASGGLVGFTSAFPNIAPTPTRAGDVIYWNGSIWTTLAGNNSGTNILQENASGVPSWVAAGAGTVTSVATSGLATGGPISTTGTVTVTAAVKSDQTTGSSTTVAVVPGVQQYHASAAKAWVNFAGSSGTINASYNVSSVSRASAGNYTVNFTTSFANTGYACFGTAEDTSTNEFIKVGSGVNKTVSAIAVNALSSFSATADPANVNVVCFGAQ